MARGTSAVRLDGLPPDEVALPHPEWRRHLGPVLSRQQVVEALGVAGGTGVDELVERGQLLGLPTLGQELIFPAFQFGDDGQLIPGLPAILAAFDGVVISPYTIASWFVTPQIALGRRTPVTWLRRGKDPEQVKEAARRSAARLGQ